jgi:hypothetical protein
VMDLCVEVHHTVIRKAALKHAGYEVMTEG